MYFQLIYIDEQSFKTLQPNTFICICLYNIGKNWYAFSTAQPELWLLSSACHTSENPESSYINWIATLHPENAFASMDQSLSSQLVLGGSFISITRCICLLQHQYCCCYKFGQHENEPKQNQKGCLEKFNPKVFNRLTSNPNALSYGEAIRDRDDIKKWNIAAQLEIEGLEQNQTWTEVDVSTTTMCMLPGT